jgi:hypothetical protein
VAFANLRDENLLRLYDNIRDQVDRDRVLRHKLTSGDAVRQHAEELRAELTRRRLQHAPINSHHLCVPKI